ncbi:MAG: helix-turn-helix domain-containing protein [Leptospirales bacterium]
MRPDAVKKIRIALLEKGWNQEVLADRLGISPTYLSLIISGRRTGRRLLPGISRILEIPIQTLSE